MICAAAHPCELAGDHARGDAPDDAPADWLIQIALWLAQLVSVFTSGAARLRMARRRGRYPANWREQAAQLPFIEAEMALSLSSAVRRVLAGADPDLWRMSAPDEDELSAAAACRQPPRTPGDLARRLEVLARIMADLEGHVRRIAARIMRAGSPRARSRLALADVLALAADAPPGDPAARREGEGAVRHPASCAMRCRAPP